MDELKYDNVDHIRIRDDYYMNDSTSSEIFKRYDIPPFEGSYGGNVSLRDFELKYIINQAHNKGMGVTIIPSFGDFNFPREMLAPTDWAAWFDNYGRIINHYAEIANKTGVDILFVGHTLINVSGTISYEDWGNYFKILIENTRKIYHGPLASVEHVPNATNFKVEPLNWNKITFWNDLDIIGCGTSSPTWRNITDTNEPTYDEVYNYFIDHTNTIISELLKVANKPFLYYENGIVSVDSALIDPNWAAHRPSEMNLDLSEQKIYFRAIFEAMKDIDWFFGHGCYHWSFMTFSGGPNDFGLTPRRKPAEKVIRNYYGNGDTKRRIIEIDGIFDDWLQQYLLKTDTIGDSKISSSDLYAVYGCSDDMYLYLMFEIYGRMRDQDVFVTPIDIDQDSNPDLPLGVFFGGKKPHSDIIWLAGLSADMTWSSSLAFADVETDTNKAKFELQIPLSVLGNPPSINLIGVELIDNPQKELLDKIDGIIPINNISNIKNSKFKNVVNESFSLFQNYPNPFNSETIIKYEIQKSSNIQLRVLNIRGQEVATLFQGIKKSGHHQIIWNGNDYNGFPVPSGIYFIYLQSEKNKNVKKSLLIR